ncbi:hypothetical protein [Actinomycetospora aeridis]|uniref:Uncharacterized protein n=1 Tax=Actinomycetospora aeridis TaxID=3129231 RepID=A0ABU8NHB0_9PSEU
MPRRTDAPLGDGNPYIAADDREDELDDDWDDPWDDPWDDEEVDELELHLRLEAVDRLCAELRDLVGATVERQDPHVASTFVATRIRTAAGHLPGDSPDPADGRLDGAQVALTLQVWLAVAGKTQPDVGLVSETVTWVADVLGRSGSEVEPGIRVIEVASAPAGTPGLRADTGDIAALIWILAGVVAVGRANKVLWLAGLNAVGQRGDR